MADKDKRDLIPFGRFGWEKLIFRLHLPKELKTVAWAAAMWADTDGSNVRVGMRLLADGLELSERQVGVHMDRLEELGLLELVRRGGIVRVRDGAVTTLPNVYQLTSPGDGFIPMRLDPHGVRLIERVKKAPPKGRPDPKPASGEADASDPKPASGQELVTPGGDPKPTSGETTADLDVNAASDPKPASGQEEIAPGPDPKPTSDQTKVVLAGDPKPTSGHVEAEPASDPKPTSGEAAPGPIGDPKPTSGEPGVLTRPDPKPASPQVPVDNSEPGSSDPKPASGQGESGPKTDPKPASGQETSDPKPSAALPEAGRSLTRSGLRSTNKDQPLTNTTPVVFLGGDLTSPPVENDPDDDDEYDAAWKRLIALPDGGAALISDARAVYASQGRPDVPLRLAVVLAAVYAPQPPKDRS